MISPYSGGRDNYIDKELRAPGSGFDPKRDAHVNIDLVAVAKKLNQTVDMSEHEFRKLLE